MIINTSCPHAVRFNEQTLTEEQKEQARTNIGAASSKELEELKNTGGSIFTNYDSETGDLNIRSSTFVYDETNGNLTI